MIDIYSIKYGGRLIHAVEDDFGSIEIIDIQQSLRSMHFGNSTQQATMSLENPNQLIHQYTEAMLLPLCWLTPNRTLMLGLGGGSMAKFIHHHVPGGHLDAVELRHSVVQLAHDYFQLAEPNDSLSIHTEKAEEFISTADNKPYYDLIIVDLFLTKQNATVTIPLTQHLTKLKSMLTKTGQICINIMGHHFKYNGYQQLQKLFPKALYVVTADVNNFILIGGKQPIPESKTIDFSGKEIQYNLPFQEHYSKLTRQR
ncbi:MAG: hypothetical protein HOM11_10750 [Methylococcales bacterium]|jgi:spermidine synthase|nr:hypothetical protein [Methylococcales bacterium]MBT7444476.1 hypothetical protein [Methylococcales bacterium]